MRSNDACVRETAACVDHGYSLDVVPRCCGCRATAPDSFPFAVIGKYFSHTGGQGLFMGTLNIFIVIPQASVNEAPVAIQPILPILLDPWNMLSGDVQEPMEGCLV